MFRLRKWYLDLLTPGGDYLFLYFAFVRVAGIAVRSLVVHLAPFGGARALTIPFRARSFEDHAGDDRHVLVRLDAGVVRVGPEGCQVLVSSDKLSLDLSYVPVVRAGRERVRIDGPRGSHILWEPVGLRYRVEGRAEAGPVRIIADGAAGYADFLESTILPLEVPVRRLYWGRIHGPDADLVFMQASGRGGKPSWSRLVVRGEGLQVSEHVAITENPGGYLLASPLPGGEFRMSVKRQRKVQESSFVDQQQLRLPILSALAKWVTRDPRSTKFLSRAAIPAWGGEFSMIDEEADL